jgi:membrane-associated phospholipid phosphatase
MARGCSRLTRRPRAGRALAAVATCVFTLAGAAVAGAQATSPNDTTQKLGNIGQFAPVVGGVLLSAAHKDSKGFAELALSSATTLAIVHSLKPLIDKTRPNGGGRSFPSGHTAIAFAGAGFVQRRYGWAWGAPAYAVGVFVGYSRVHAKEHWTEDVIAGGAIGLASSYVFTRRYHGVTVTPMASRGGPGLTLSIAW